MAGMTDSSYHLSVPPLRNPAAASLFAAIKDVITTTINVNIVATALASGEIIAFLRAGPAAMAGMTDSPPRLSVPPLRNSAAASLFAAIKDVITTDKNVMKVATKIACRLAYARIRASRALTQFLFARHTSAINTQMLGCRDA